MGGGPSLPLLLENKVFDQCPVIAVNDAFRFGSWIDVCFFGDTKWYWWNKEDLKAFTGLKVTCNRMRDPRKAVGEIFPTVEGEPDLRIVQYSNGYGICSEPNKVYFNSSSGAAAINLAWHLGARKVVLVGYDMRVINNSRNWRPHPNVIPGSTPKGFKHFIKPFDRIARDAKRLKLKVVNATPESGLQHFPFVELEQLCTLWTSLKR